MSCEDLISEELDVIESIYPDYLSRQNETILLNIPIDLEEIRTIQISSNGTRLHKDNNESHLELQISKLPPFRLEVTLPSSYPLDEPPLIKSFKWLPEINLDDLHEPLQAMWATEGVLFSWVEFLRSGDFLESIGLTSRENTIIQYVR